MSRTGLQIQKNEKIILEGSDVLAVKVKPNSKRSKILGFDAKLNEYLVEIAAPAEDNKANMELIRLLKKETGKNPKIISGATSKRKLVRLL